MIRSTRERSVSGTEIYVIHQYVGVLNALFHVADRDHRRLTHHIRRHDSFLFQESERHGCRLALILHLEEGRTCSACSSVSATTTAIGCPSQCTDGSCRIGRSLAAKPFLKSVRSNN